MAYNFATSMHMNHKRNASDTHDNPLNVFQNKTTEQLQTTYFLMI